MKHPIFGHQRLLKRLGASIASGRFPQATLLVGPEGVGKQRIALWAAQTSLCEQRGEAPCGQCKSCLQIQGLAHPDVHWIVPLALKKKSSDPDKQIDEVAAALADIMQDRRNSPTWEKPESAAAHSIAAVRLIHRVVARKPYQGSRKVIIIGDAGRLVVQAGSLEAANALLKVLEEPPADTTIILSAESAHTLLPTIRSRCTPVRVSPVAEDDVVAFAREVLGQDSGRSARTAKAAQGRCGAAIASGSSELTEQAAELVRSLSRPEEFLAASLKQAPFGARGGFADLLDALAVRLRGKLADADTADRDLRKPLQALEIINKHRALTRQNVNPQLAMAVLTTELSEIR